MKSLSQAKGRSGFPKNVKLTFCPVLGLFYDFIKNLIVRFMYEDDVNPTWFFLVISMVPFQVKKIKFHFAHVSFCSPKVLTKLLRFCSRYGLWHLINVEQNVSHVSDFCPNNSILLIFYGNNHYDIHLIVQLSHKGNSKLLKIFTKSISLGILGCNYGFFKKKKFLFLAMLRHFAEHYEARKNE